MTYSNKYDGICHGCKCEVKRQLGYVERIGRTWRTWCTECFDQSDNSSWEDRECGNRAYEDRCSEICNGW